MLEKEEIFSKVLRAGRRTYFFDVRATKADDYYITIINYKLNINHITLIMILLLSIIIIN